MIAGFDLGENRTGWCTGTGDGDPKVGAWRYASDDIAAGDKLGVALEEFDQDLGRFLTDNCVAHVVAEAPLMLKWDSMLTLRRIYGRGAHLQWVCHKRGISYREESPAALKKRLTGSHKAKKDDMVHVVTQKLGLVLPATKADGREDAADGVAAWLIGVDVHARRFQGAWDKRLYSARGALL